MARFLSPRLAEVVYTVLLRPRPLRRIAHRILLRLIPEKVRIDGIDLLLNPRDPVLSPAVAFGVYEPWEQQLFRTLCRPGDTVVDIGANVGLYTAIAARAVGSAGRVISLEPHLESYSYLQKTIAINGLTHVRAVNAACGDHSGTVDLFLTDENKADSRLYDVTGARPRTTVEMVTLDDLLEREGVRKVDVIKMDIQGAEALALKGMRRTLRTPGKLTLVCEFWPWGITAAGGSPREFIEELSSHGFTFHSIDEDRHRADPIPDIGALLANQRDEYTSMTLQRSHFNLLCVRE